MEQFPRKHNPLRGLPAGGILFLLLALSLRIHSVANAWAPPSQASFAMTRRSSCSSWRTPSLFMSTEDTENNEEKIAQLEAELRKLKGEQEAASAPVEEPPAEPEEEMLDEATMDMFLSEGWKQAKDGYDPNNTATMARQNEEQGSIVGLVAKVVGGIVALVVFAQIPVGQEDLSKYSANTSGATKTTIDLGDTNRVKGEKQNAEDTMY